MTATDVLAVAAVAAVAAVTQLTQGLRLAVDVLGFRGSA
jgi:hypothetical protein